MANPRRYRQTGHYNGPPLGADESQWRSEKLTEYAQRITAGDSWALFLAIEDCSRWNIALPEWFRYQLRTRINRYQSAEVRELGEAFGITRPKNWNHPAARDWHRKALPVFYWIEARIEEGAKVPAVFDEAATVAGISFKRAEEYFYAIKGDKHPGRD